MAVRENSGRRQYLPWSRFTGPVLARKGLANVLISAGGYKWDPVGILGLCTDTAVSTLVHKYVPEA